MVLDKERKNIFESKCSKNEKNKTVSNNNNESEGAYI